MLTFKKSEKKQGNLFLKIVLTAMALVLLLFILYSIPFFQQIIGRFVNNDGTSYNAIDGRLFFWTSQFGDKTAGDLVFGFGEVALEEDVYYTGFMKILYAYGIVGMTLYSIFLLYMLFITRGLARTYIIVYIGLLFLANLVGFISIIFNIGIIITFYLQDLKQRSFQEQHNLSPILSTANLVS